MIGIIDYIDAATNRVPRDKGGQPLSPDQAAEELINRTGDEWGRFTRATNPKKANFFLNLVLWQMKGQNGPIPTYEEKETP